MKYNKISYSIVLSLIFALLVSAIPAHAASGSFYPNPIEGRIGDWIEINGYGFGANEVLRIYFSSNWAKVGDAIDDEVIAYKRLMIASTDADGGFLRTYQFAVPDKLTDGRVEDVHGGYYYLYATRYDDKTIICWAGFTVIDGEIELAPIEGTVGTEVEITGEGLRSNQKISVECEGDVVDIISGDRETDSDGQFTCTVVIPESTAGNHIITVIDESGDRPGAEFSVKPKITLDPSEQAAGGEVTVNGTGFTKREVITISVDGSRTSTTPLVITTNHDGSFSASFAVPFYYGRGSSKIEASDIHLNRAETQLTILAGMVLDPITSPASPGNVGMELTVSGAGFTVNAPVTITYTSNGEVIPVAEAKADANGNFSASFTIPSSVAGSHAVTATDGTSTLTSTFTMESEAPPVPVLLSPKVTSPAEAEVHFDWGDVTDPSGVSYTLQVASDADFANIVLGREGLQRSEYTMSGEELESMGKEAYWRVKAVDGASNESEWAFPWLFYVGSPRAPLPGWAWYIFYGLGVLLLVIVGWWVRKWRSR